MESAARVLVFEAAPHLGGAVSDRLRQRGFSPVPLDLEQTGQQAGPLGACVALVLIDTEQTVTRGEQLAALLRRLVDEHVATLVWGRGEGVRGASGPLVEWLAPDVSLDEVVGRLTTLARYAPLIKGFERELDHLQRLGRQLNHYFSQIDQEMRLAGRLQRNFLPRQFPEFPPYTFHVIYRPASWVSGDMYDVFAVDAHHIGVFVADAMGHGVAAGLLTMFLRHALVKSRAGGEAEALLAPAKALASLDACLVKQQLPNCQFVTAAYGILDTRSGDLRLARAGHPYPLHVARDGMIAELRIEGSLLGLSSVPPRFEEAHLRPGPGEKIILYTDGVEDALAAPRGAKDEETTFTPQFRRWACQPGPELVKSIDDFLDCRAGSLHPADDITLLVLEVGR